MFASRYLLLPLLVLLLASPIGAWGAPQTNAASKTSSVSIAPNGSAALVAAPGSTSLSSGGNAPAQGTNDQNQPVSNWQASMLQNPPAQAGCFVAIYGSNAWQSSTCGIAPDVPNIPSGASSGPPAEDVGNGNDDVASSPGTKIGSSVGSFPAISGLTSEGGVPGPAFPGSGWLTGNGTPDCYSLQLNTQTFTCNTTFTGGISTTCWEQFVSSNTGSRYIHFFLLGHR